MGDNKLKILVVDDEATQLDVYKHSLSKLGHKVQVAPSGAAAFKACAAEVPDVALVDYRMMEMNGIDVGKALRKEYPAMVLIMVTGHGIEQVLPAMAAGFDDYLVKNASTEQLKVAILKAQRLRDARRAAADDAIRRQSLEPVDQQNRTRVAKGMVPAGTVFKSPAMAQVVAEAMKGASVTTIPIFVLGPSGAGKNHLIEVITQNDPRGQMAPSVHVNCGAIPKDNHIPNLFGYKKGDYTGALKDFLGKLREADNGNLILDEVHNLSPEAQQALLHVVETGAAQDYRGRPYSVTVRVILASNKKRSELEKYLAGDFLERLWVWPIEIPTLNVRREDIRPLAMEFLRLATNDAGTAQIDDEAMRFLEKYDWSRGEVRQLRNTIVNAVTQGGATVTLSNIQAAIEKLSREFRKENSASGTARARPEGEFRSSAQMLLDEWERVCKGIVGTGRISLSAIGKQLGCSGPNLSGQMNTHAAPMTKLFDAFPQEWPILRSRTKIVKLCRNRS